MTGKQLTDQPTDQQTLRESRRCFLKSITAASVVGPTLHCVAPIARAAHSGGSDTLRVGLIGCGGRGTGAAAQALSADPQTKLTALGDAFENRLTSSLGTLKTTARVADRVDVPRERQFVGFDAYQSVIDSGVDVVLLATPPQFRPIHLQAAVAAGKHVFAEKPVAVDAPGVRSILKTCDEAAKKGLTIVSGLCLRNYEPFRDVIRRIHDGAIGRIMTLQAWDLRGPIWVKQRKAEWSDMEWQMRNWYYFTWLSGDFNVEQHVHYLDVCAWIMGGRYPDRAVGMGGRQVRTDPRYGNIFDHHSVAYEYDDGATLFSNTRQQKGCAMRVMASATGEQGKVELDESGRRPTMVTNGNKKWKYRGKRNNIYQTEHDEMFAAIRAGEPINNGQYMAKSTLLAIMGRMATYTGKEVTWDQAFHSTEDLSPPQFEWGPLETPAIAIPGKTALR